MTLNDISGPLYNSAGLVCVNMFAAMTEKKHVQCQGTDITGILYGHLIKTYLLIDLLIDTIILARKDL